VERKAQASRGEGKWGVRGRTSFTRLVVLKLRRERWVARGCGGQVECLRELVKRPVSLRGVIGELWSSEDEKVGRRRGRVWMSWANRRTVGGAIKGSTMLLARS
jgi:hypothetical protein